MFCKACVRLRRTVPPADYSMMKPALAHRSPTVPAAFATAVAISLSGFLLAGAGFQGEPAPLLPAVGSAAGRVIAKLPAAAPKRVPEPVTRAAGSTTLAAILTQAFAPQLRAEVSKPRRVHRPAPAIRRAAPARVPAPAPAPRATPIPTRVFPKTPEAKGKARGHSHSHAHAHTLNPAVGTHVHGHDKALGHQRGLPPGHAKKAPAAPHPAQAAPPKATGGPPADHGGGNGHNGGKK
jgi:hypothetical protein